MSGHPDFFAPLPSEKTIGRRNGVSFSRESRERVGSFEKYRNAITALADKVGDLETYNGDGQIAGWFEAHQRHLAYLDAKRIAFIDQLRSFADTPPKGPNSSSEVVTGLRRLPHPNTELLQDIRALLAQLVDGQTHTVVNNFAGIESTNEDRAESREAATTPDAPAVRVTPEVIEAVAEFLFDTGVFTEIPNALRSVAKCFRNDIDDPISGKPQVTEQAKSPEATDDTDTPAGIDTSPLVVHRLAALQDAEGDYRKLQYELAEAAHRVKSCALDLEFARLDEVSPREESGKFSNRRRPSARFSHPTPPDQKR